MVVLIIIIAVFLFGFLSWCLVRGADERRYGIKYPEEESEVYDIYNR